MARIRTVKPILFRHEGLQDLESANPGKFVMLVFIGIFGHCDKRGNFEWNARQLKLDILPFLNFDMEDTLSLLEKAGQIIRYTCKNKVYGNVPTFLQHQRITGKEAQEPKKYPSPEEAENYVSNQDENTKGNNRETTEKQPRLLGMEYKEEEEEGISCASAQDRDAFEIFWQAYPKKKSKGDAQKAFKALKGHPVAELVAAIERAKTSAQWQRDGGQYIPFPATWLRAKGWLDESDKPALSGLDAFAAEMQKRGFDA